MDILCCDKLSIYSLLNYSVCKAWPGLPSTGSAGTERKSARSLVLHTNRCTIGFLLTTPRLAKHTHSKTILVYTSSKKLLLRGLPHGSSLLVSALMTSSEGRGHVGKATLHWLAADVSPAHIPMKAAYWYFALGLFMSVQATGAPVWGLKGKF